MTRKDGAPGIDGMTATEYDANLETNLHPREPQCPSQTARHRSESAIGLGWNAARLHRYAHLDVGGKSVANAGDVRKGASWREDARQT
jgi:hypothetical protein